MSSTPKYGIDTAAGQAYVGILGFFWLLAIVSVTLRIWAKHIRGRPYMVHDWLMFAALVCSSKDFSISALHSDKCTE